MIVVLVFTIVLSIANGKNIQVTTAQGTIEGYQAKNGDYYAFSGIPYAMPLTVLDSFKISAPPQNFSNVFYAVKGNIQCARPSPSGMVGIINCLVLNVFTRNINDSNPVLVWLNGEETDPNISSKFSFKRLIDENIVVVTLNYRLSLYGFLCLKTEQHPGNAGLKDIILGLQWVKKNIAAFGGNNKNLILMGHGSAAAMADLITLTPQSKDLVHKAIVLSGSAIAPWVMSRDPLNTALSFTRKVNGIPQTEQNYMTTFLAFNSRAEINNAFNNSKYTFNTPIFGPCIENASLDGALLIEAPIKLLRAGEYPDIPFIAGYMTEDGTLRAREVIYDRWLERMEANFSNFLPDDLDFGDKREAIAQDIRQFYFGDGPINIIAIDKYLKYYADTMVIVPIIRGLRERAATSSSEVRLLEFGYMGASNYDWKLGRIPLNGARHGSILNYIFDFDLISYDETVADSIVKRISAFAHAGIPTPVRDNPPSFADWLAFQNEPSPRYLSYSGNRIDHFLIQSNKEEPQADTMTFWNQLYDLYYKSPSSASGLISLKAMILLTVLILVFL